MNHPELAQSLPNSTKGAAFNWEVAALRLAAFTTELEKRFAQTNEERKELQSRHF
jgi:hypothetical protein